MLGDFVLQKCQLLRRDPAVRMTNDILQNPRKVIRSASAEAGRENVLLWLAR